MATEDDNTLKSTLAIPITPGMAKLAVTPEPQANDTQRVRGASVTAGPTPKLEVDEFGLPIARPKSLDIQHNEGEVMPEHAGGSKHPIDEKGVNELWKGRKPGVTRTPGNETAIEGKQIYERDILRTSISSNRSNGTRGDKSNRNSLIASDAPPAEKPTVSEWSHQAASMPTAKKEEEGEEDEGEWQEMPAYASYDLYDDDGRLIAKEQHESEDEGDGAMGGASKGYTRVGEDEDAKSTTSMDENTSYLFKEDGDDEASKNPLSQMQATKELLTEGQRIAYVGVCRLAMIEMVRDQEKLKGGRGVKKALGMAVEATKMWSQKMINRLYSHMEISPEEQIMIEQLAEHGVLPSDLTPALMKNSRVHNPLNEAANPLASPPRPTSINSHRASVTSADTTSSAPPPYTETPEVRNPNQLPASKTLDIDLRWTVLCDLFLVLIADSVYDARSRTLLERVGGFLDIAWMDICKFEKKVTDALEMQEAAQQNWSEEDHMENRRKQARNRRYMMMGLATIGGGLVIGLSGGLLAPVIGAGLAAGFTTIGVAGTSGFLAGAGGTAVIASTAVVSGSTIGAKASARRTAHVKTFEYRPLHNAKRVNLIITISGWMTSSKDDDVRLPFSTVDPIMGDIFSVLWEPEMLRSMGQTINILATEVLTQSLQQILGSTILVALMASIQLPVVLTKLSYLLDNPWSVSLDRAWAAGLILADSLTSRNLGVRPVTLVGYSLGARVIYSCLLELSRLHAYGLVQNVYLFGSPVVVKKDDYMKAKSVVPGRFVNGYARNDWILGYLFRATSGGIGRVAGLAPIDDIPGIENVDVTELVEGHMAYRQAVPKLLRKVGWLVLDDEFSEIEDPDPEKHRERQRELINELDTARKKLEEGEPKKSRFGFFGRKSNPLKKKEWETYDEATKKAEEAASRDSEKGTSGNNNGGSGSAAVRTPYDEGVIFDVDAIRKELAVQQDLEQKRLEQEKIDALSLSLAPTSPGLRHTKSFNDAPALRNQLNSSSGYHHKSSLQTIQSPIVSTFGMVPPIPPPKNNNNDNYYYNEYSDDEDEFGNKRTRGGDDGEIQMTFDTWGASASTNRNQPSPPPVYPPRSSSSMGTYTPSASYAKSDWKTTQSSAATRRTVSASYAAPAPAPAAPKVEERNVWKEDDFYDDDDEEEDVFGHEKEMTMSFA